MLSRKWKIIFVMCGFATLLYVHSSDHRIVKEYRTNMQQRMNDIIERTRNSNNTDILALLNYSFQSSKNDRPKIPSELHGDFTEISTLTKAPISGSVNNNLTKEVVFPKTNDCDKKQYNLMLKNHKGPTVSTNFVYPCKKWRYPNKKDDLWPIVVEPSNGKVLNSIDIDKRVKPKVQDKVREQLVVQQERVRRLRDTCEKYPQLSLRQYVVFVWDTKTEPPVIYCPLYKVASTTWMVYFMRLAHVNDDNPLLEIYKRSGQERKKYMPRFGGGHQRVFKEFKAPNNSVAKNEVFKKSLRFIVVRHPFARLLSAYRDKIERPSPKPFLPFFKDLQSAIIKKYRLEGSKETSSTPTFSEFVNYVIDSTQNFTTAIDWEENVLCWTPFWSQCGVCSTDYQVVIKLETMEDDEQFLAHIADLKEIQNVHEWRNLKRKSVSSSVVLPKYYGSLTKQQILLLYDRYKIDFELFGYTLDDYL